MFKFVNKYLKNKRGDILQLVVVVIVVGVLAINVLPGIIKGITDKGLDSTKKIEKLDDALK